MIDTPGYRIIKRLGSGGMSIVYLAEHEKLGHSVAIKVLSDVLTADDTVRKRFLQEARLMASLRHKGIVPVNDFIEMQNTLAIVMEYIEGRNLSDMIGLEVGPFPWERALPLFKQVLNASSYAHQRCVIHRDLKPSNIMVTPDGTTRIMDFGIAKITGSEGHTRTGTKLGTLYYMSPEQIRGEKNTDKRADIYSLGMTLYEMLAGRLPFDTGDETSEWQITQKIVYDDYEPPSTYYPHIPDWLVKVVQKATTKDPSERYQSCEEFLEALSCKEPLEISRADETLERSITLSQVETGERKKSRLPSSVVSLPSGMKFVTIPSGSFQMGSPSSESGIATDEKLHLVTVSPFELMTTQVTQGMWKEVMGSNPASGRGVGSDYPVFNMSWNDCQEYISRLNSMDSRHNYRLPTEVEWEYASRAGTTTRYYWGDDPKETQIGNYAWYADNSNNSIHPVGTKLPNSLGLYDMSGNVWEWCEDFYTDNYDDCPTDGSAYTGSGSYRVGRGGSVHSRARFCRSACRRRCVPGFSLVVIGLRLARLVS